MNWNQIEGNWKQLKGNAKQQWGKLTEDQLDVIAGKREHLAGVIQEAYGVTREVAEQQLAEWQSLLHELPGFKKGRPGFAHTSSDFTGRDKS